MHDRDCEYDIREQYFMSHFSDRIVCRKITDTRALLTSVAAQSDFLWVSFAIVSCKFFETFRLTAWIWLRNKASIDDWIDTSICDCGRVVSKKRQGGIIAWDSSFDKCRHESKVRVISGFQRASQIVAARIEVGEASIMNKHSLQLVGCVKKSSLKTWSMRLKSKKVGSGGKCAFVLFTFDVLTNRVEEPLVFIKCMAGSTTLRGACKSSELSHIS